MGLSDTQIHNVESVIKAALQNRFESYNPEPAVMPFHTRLLGKDRLALYAFIHSLNTNFGTTIFEPVAVALAANRFEVVKSQVKLGTKISTPAQFGIQKIIDGLTTADKKPDKPKETASISAVCREGEMRTVKPTRVDVYLEHRGEVYLFDIKTAKPNRGGFEKYDSLTE